MFIKCRDDGQCWIDVMPCEPCGPELLIRTRNDEEREEINIVLNEKDIEALIAKIRLVQAQLKAGHYDCYRDEF